MIFSVSSDGIQWTLDFGPDSVTIAVNDLDQNITISSQEIPLTAWQNAPTTPVSERPTEPPRLQRSRAFGARIENVPDYVYRNLFE